MPEPGFEDPPRSSAPAIPPMRTIAEIMYGLAHRMVLSPPYTIQNDQPNTECHRELTFYQVSVGVLSRRIRAPHDPSLGRALRGDNGCSPSYCARSAGGAPLSVKANLKVIKNAK